MRQTLFLAAALSASILAQGQVSHTISEIQGQLFSSPLVGQTVTTQGIISANNMTSATAGVIGYFIQDAPGPWNGVYVYDNTQSPNIGDLVQITAEVSEYFDNTELVNVVGFEVISTGNPVPTPTSLTTAQVASTESYEGCLVSVGNAVCVNPDAGFGEAEFNDGTGICKTNDYMYIPEAGWSQGTAYWLTGVVNYHYNEYKIEPRNASDVSTTTGIASAPAAVSGFQVYPNPATDRVQWDLPAAAQADATWILFNAWGQPVAERAGFNGNATWDVSGLAPGRYVLECRTPAGIFRAPFQKAGR
ncbi:MAG: Phospholipase precursor [Bacteroidota bacterium]|jgi:hypothetical protein